MTQPYDVLDGPQQLQLPPTERGHLRHGRGDADVDAHHRAGVLELGEQLRQRPRGRGQRHQLRDHPEVDHRVGLDLGAVEHPRLARPHPADRIRVDAVPEQPYDAVGGGLARTDDDVLARRRGTRQLVGGDDAGAVDGEGRRRLRRDVGRQVPRVDDPAPLAHLVALPRVPRHEGPVTEVVAPAEQLDPTSGEHAFREDLVVVREDRPLVRTLVQPRLGAGGLAVVAAEQGRGDAVEGRRLVQLDERVGPAPVSADAVAAVDQRHRDVRVIDQGVGERHPRGTGADHQVVDVDQVRRAVGHARPRRRRSG